jgi:acetylglutamate kinase
VSKTKSSTARRKVEPAPKAIPAPGEADLASVYAKAKILSEALPFMQRYDNATVVVKYGGHAMGDLELATDFARDIVLIKQAGVNPIVVHGGGPQIGSLLERLNIKSEFKGGLRVTDRETVEVVEMVLAGSVNKEIVAAINAQGGKAVGISGKDANLMRAARIERLWRDPDSNIESIVDMGFVGEPAKVDAHIIDVIIQSDLIPVVAPIGVGAHGETLNVNADTFAGALAGAMKAKRLLLLTDVDGVLDKRGNLIKSLTTHGARALIADGTISGGMIPKIESCIAVVDAGVEAVVIINGKVPHAVLLELFTEHGAGTLISGRRADARDG